jgi:hypothetical protein
LREFLAFSRKGCTTGLNQRVAAGDGTINRREMTTIQTKEKYE